VAAISYRVLGPLEVRIGADTPALGPRQQRAVLALLLLHAREVVSTDRLTEWLWAAEPPANALTAIQGYVSALRKILGRETIETVAGGYRLRADDEQIDARRFERLYLQAQAALAEEDLGRASAHLEEALDVLHCAPLVDFAYEAWAQAEIGRLEELQLSTREAAFDVRLERADHAALVGELEAFRREHPLREGASRRLMLALYRSGRQAEALEVYQEARSTLVEELGVEPGPELQSLYRSILRQDDGLAVPEPIVTPRATNLPAPPARLIGRGREVDDVAALLGDDAVRLVTLTGPGGIGKTRLALEIAACTALRYRDGVVFVDLSPVSTPDDAIESIRQALDLGPDPAHDSLETVTSHLRDRRLLLVLDNLEQVIELAQPLAALLSAAGLVDVLATSREALRIRAERQFRLAELSPEDAVQLFRDRAEAVAPGIVDPDDPRLESLVRELDCLPLALELAASRVDTLAPGAMLERIGERLALLQGGPRDLPERQQALRATLDWSYDLLSAEEQRAFERLGIFRRGCTPDAAAAVAEAPHGIVESLVRKNLVRIDDLDRIGMLETVRAYAIERLEARTETNTTAAEHARWFARLADEGGEELRGPEGGAWAARLEAEYDNLRSALEWLAEHDRAAALRLCDRLWPAWLGQGHLREAKRWFDRLLTDADDVPLDLLADCLGGAGVIAAESGDLDAARKHLQRGLGYRRELGDERKVALALNNLGQLEEVEGHLDEAMALTAEAVSLLRRLDDVPNLTLTLIGLANVQSARGELASATLTYGEAADLARSCDDTWALAASLAGRGTTALREEDFETASSALTESLLLMEARGERNEFVPLLFELGHAAIGLGDEERGVRLIGASAALRERLGGPFETADAAAERERIRASVGANRFDALEAVGRALDEREAIALAASAGTVVP
jgi:predicted ATPase/DNA-binding SARP family transcriptional activator